MPAPGAAHCALATADWRDGTDGVERASLTERLGCSDTAVGAYRFDGGASVPLLAGPEQVCLALEGRIRLVGTTLSASRATVQAVAVEPREFEGPDTSDVATAHLTGAFACRGVKCNARRLTAGQRVPYHTEGDQEELFVPVRGPSAMEIDGERIETSPGTVVRVAPPVPRSARTDEAGDAPWVTFGAPPTGGPTDWDPGATILDR